MRARKKEIDLNIDEYLQTYAPKPGTLSFYIHLARYDFCLRFINTVREPISWLDCGSGEGFGVAYLAKKAIFENIVSIDIHQDILVRANKIYGKELKNYNSDSLISFVCADVCNMPFKKGSFNLVTAFDLIEHVEKPDRFLEQIKKIVKPKGILLLSTPNKLKHMLKHGEIYPYHSYEYYLYEFICLIRKVFEVKVEFFGQNPYLLSHYRTKLGSFFKPSIYQRALNKLERIVRMPNSLKLAMPNFDKIRKECSLISDRDLDVCEDFIAVVYF